MVNGGSFDGVPLSQDGTVWLCGGELPVTGLTLPEGTGDGGAGGSELERRRERKISAPAMTLARSTPCG
jgi:hypothetical protein